MVVHVVEQKKVPAFSISQSVKFALQVADTEEKKMAVLAELLTNARGIMGGLSVGPEIMALGVGIVSALSIVHLKLSMHEDEK